jgi:putative NADPH-quinone reductase
VISRSKGTLFMKTTILLAHPWHGSFNKAIFDTVVNKLTSLNKPYQIIDLNKDGFNPV